jgi:hypothetical protein
MDSIGQGQPQIEFVTLQPTAPGFPGGVNYDQVVAFSKPYYVIGLANTIQSDTINIFISLIPTGLNNLTGFISIQVQGTENWIPLLNNQNSAGEPSCRYIRFRKPVQRFFVSSDHGSGPTGPFTLFGTNDLTAYMMRVSG